MPIAQVRAAKIKAAHIFSQLAEVNGVGITRVDEGYGLKINLMGAPEHSELLPTEVDGVPVAVEVVGRIAKQPL